MLICLKSAGVIWKCITKDTSFLSTQTCIWSIKENSFLSQRPHYRYMGFVDKYCIQKSLMNSTFIGEVEFVILLVSRFSDYMIQPPSKACSALGECCIYYCWFAVAEGGSNTANFKMLYILLARVIV